MLLYPDIDPVAFSLGPVTVPWFGWVVGPVAVHWYGLMYLVGFITAWWLGQRRAKLTGGLWKSEYVDDVLFYIVLGVIIGGRLGHVVFYNFSGFLANPFSVFAIWEGGMSFHGGLIGVIVAMALFARRRGLGFFQVADFVAPLVPPGIGYGRIGNFINGRLWGKPTDLPWGMVFPNADDLARHPSQLYQAALEGLALFLILWFYSSRPRPTMAVSGMFLLWYGIFRIAMEFVRVPDAGQYLAFDWITKGQVLSLPMILAGVWLVVAAHRQGTPQPVVDLEVTQKSKRAKTRRKRRK